MLRSVVIAALIFALASADCVAAAPEHGFYAEQASPIWAHIAFKPGVTLSFPSPDGRSMAQATFTQDEGVVMRLSGAIGEKQTSIGPGVGSEILWSPDSRAVFVTTSDDGANGLYRTIVMGRISGQIIIRDLSPLIVKAFGHPFVCGWTESPNVGGIAWTNGSTHLVLAAEVIAHSNCDSFGTFRAYEVDWRTQAIVRTYDQIEAKRRFDADIGTELKNAPDKCIINPKSCWVAFNHQ